MQLIIFDIDGTLAGTDYEEDLCYAHAFESVVGRSLEGLEYHSCQHVTDSAITDHFFQQLFGRNALPHEVEALKLAFRQQLESKYTTHPQLFREIPGAAALFKRLQSRDDVALGISTGAWKLPAAFKLDVIEVDTTHVAFHGADEHYAKLYSINQVIAESKARLNSDGFELITYVGDRTYDMHTSQQLGINFIGVDHKNTGILHQAGATMVLPHFNEPERFEQALNLS